jgi:hypothetical protein
MQDQTKELRAHLKEKELREGEDSPLALTLPDYNITIPDELTSQVKYKIMSKNATGKGQRTHAAKAAERQAEMV